MLKIIVAAALAAATGLASAKTEFCRGFEEGYKTIMGDGVLVPMCPLEPLTPMGSTPYREGLKAGMEQGRKDKR